MPIYLGLIVVQGIYAYKFMKNLWYLITNVNEMDADTIMLAVLNLIDVVMIANLLVMVTLGGEIFVSKTTHEKSSGSTWNGWAMWMRPCWKVKLSMSIISISSIHLLQTFVNASKFLKKRLCGKWLFILLSWFQRLRWLIPTKSSTVQATKTINTQSVVKLTALLFSRTHLGV